MPVTSVTKDTEALTMTVVADFDAPLSRLWELYLDPRLIERFWGPPTYPAVFTRHDGHPGGRSTYVMTGPDGDESRGYWEWLTVEEQRSFEVLDGFAGPDGDPNRDLPSMRMTFRFEATDAGSRLTTTTYFNSLEELEQLLDMGMEEGMLAAMGQIDDVIDDLTSFAAGDGTVTQRLGDIRVRISRIIRGSVDDVWRAHHDADLLRRWMLGPDGWTMPVCDAGDGVGSTFRYEWERTDGTDRFGFTGEILESRPPYREVTTETTVDGEGPTTRYELTLTPVPDGTLLSLLVTYPDREIREQILSTGMADGMEFSYQRLEELVG